MDHLFMVPEVVYIILLLCSWIAALFSGIAFVYGIQLKKSGRTIGIWAVIFAACLFLVFLLMRGHIAAA